MKNYVIVYRNKPLYKGVDAYLSARQFTERDKKTRKARTTSILEIDTVQDRDIATVFPSHAWAKRVRDAYPSLDSGHQCGELMEVGGIDPEGDEDTLHPFHFDDIRRVPDESEEEEEDDSDDPEDNETFVEEDEDECDTPERLKRQKGCRELRRSLKLIVDTLVDMMLED